MTPKKFFIKVVMEVVALVSISMAKLIRLPISHMYRDPTESPDVVYAAYPGLYNCEVCNCKFPKESDDNYDCLSYMDSFKPVNTKDSAVMTTLGAVTMAAVTALAF